MTESEAEAAERYYIAVSPIVCNDCGWEGDHESVDLKCSRCTGSIEDEYCDNNCNYEAYECCPSCGSQSLTFN